MNDHLREKLKLLVQLLLIGSAYVIAGKVGLMLAVIQANTTAIWAPTGIAIATLLYFGDYVWPAIFAGALVTNIATPGTPILLALMIAAGNTLEGLAASYLIRKFANGVDAFQRPGDLFRFAFFGGVVSPIVSATIGTTGVILFGLSHWANYLQSWTTWWLGDMGGAIIIAPVLLLWLLDHKITLGKDRVYEIFLITCVVVAFSFLILANWIIFAYLVMPVFLWAALRLKQRDVATAIFAITEIFLWGTLRGYGPFVAYYHGTESLNAALLLLNAAMVSTAVTVMAFTAAVTEERNARRTLIEERSIDRAALASVGEGLIVTNRESDIVLMNPLAEALLGMSAAEVTGKKYYDVIPMEREDGTPVPISERPILATINTGRRIASDPFGAREFYVKKNGERFPVAYTKTPITLDGVIIGAIELFRDATRETEVDQAKTEFISFASHQLRTPLSVLGLSSELLRGQGELFGQYREEEVDSYVRDIQEATQQMNDIINDLLNVSRIESQSLRPAFASVRVVDLISQNLKALGPKIRRKQLKLTTRFPAQPSACITDPRLLSIIIQNLLSNAIKYTPAEGAIEVSVVQEKTHFVIVISDSGYGIPESEQANIFKKLFRASNARQIENEGSGLGLYIVKAMVEGLGGDISFVSKEGEGSTFIVRLPIGERRRSRR